MPRVKDTFESYTLAKKVEDAVRHDYALIKHGLRVKSRVVIAMLVSKHLEAMRSKRHNRAKARRAETVLNRFVSLLGPTRLVESIRRSDLRTYVEARLDDGVKPQTVNRDLSEITACLNSARLYYQSLANYKSPRAPWLEGLPRKKNTPRNTKPEQLLDNAKPHIAWLARHRRRAEKEEGKRRGRADELSIEALARRMKRGKQTFYSAGVVENLREMYRNEVRELSKSDTERLNRLKPS
jgi:hypothetical protein